MNLCVDLWYNGEYYKAVVLVEGLVVPHGVTAVKGCFSETNASRS